MCIMTCQFTHSVNIKCQFWIQSGMLLKWKLIDISKNISSPISNSDQPPKESELWPLQCPAVLLHRVWATTRFHIHHFWIQSNMILLFLK